MTDGLMEIRFVAAIRLALVGAGDEATALKLIQWLVDCAEPTKPDDFKSVALLMDGMKALNGSIRVSP